MKYAYENMSDSQFEQFIVVLNQKLLGLSVQGFAAGRDGGRDAKFIGTAEHIPSKAAPWVGTVIIQAKHTNGYNKKFSDSEFFSKDSATCVIAEEVPRIKALRTSKELDHYMLFSNRRLTGNAETEIRTHISTECGISASSILLCGVEQIETWLKHFPEVPSLVNLDPINSPLLVSPEELAEVVEALASHKKDVKDAVDDPPAPRVTYAEKNRLNNMSADYARELRRRYLADTSTIKKFMASPENDPLLKLYESVADEFQLKIIAKRQDFQQFDDVMNYLLDLLFNRDQTLSSNRRLTRALLFYMYWNCDIGKEDDATTDKALQS